MIITTQRRMGTYRDPQTGLAKTVETPTLYVLCDGDRVGRTGLGDNDIVHLSGIPSETLLEALKKEFPDRAIVFPTVLLNKDGDPVDQYGNVDDVNEDEEDEDDE